MSAARVITLNGGTADAAWERRMIRPLHRSEVGKALLDGNVRAVAPELDDLEIGGVRFGID